MEAGDVEYVRKFGAKMEWQKVAQYIMQKRAENLTMVNGKISLSGRVWKQKNTCVV